MNIQLALSALLLLVVTDNVNADYEWNGKEWVWKDTPTGAFAAEGSGTDETDTESDDEESTQRGTKVEAPPGSSNNICSFVQGGVSIHFVPPFSDEISVKLVFYDNCSLRN